MQLGIIPTDSFPALVCDVDAKQAVERLYAAKDMAPTKQLSIMCRSFSDVSEYTLGFPAPEPGRPDAFRLARQALPGPVRVLFGQCSGAPGRVLSGRVTCVPSEALLGTFVCAQSAQGTRAGCGVALAVSAIGCPTSSCWPASGAVSACFAPASAHMDVFREWRLSKYDAHRACGFAFCCWHWWSPRGLCRCRPTCTLLQHAGRPLRTDAHICCAQP